MQTAIKLLNEYFPNFILNICAMFSLSWNNEQLGCGFKNILYKKIIPITKSNHLEKADPADEQLPGDGRKPEGVPRNLEMTILNSARFR